MMFKKGEIFDMKEEEFQNNVLIPLFRAMKFQNVTAFGGGSLERGKDIVMWKSSELGQRKNFGVVVKAKKITGNAETSDGAMNVLNQIRQMLKTSYLNPVSGEKEFIHTCYVACSKDITKEAMNSIEGELENNLNKLVEWIHPGTNLFELLEKYLPEQGLIEKLSSVQSQLDEAMKIVPYRIVADSDRNFHLMPKHKNAFEEMPFVIKTKFNFDKDTPEAKLALQNFNDHFAKGTPVEIAGEFIEYFELPDFLPDWIKSLLMPSITGDSKLILEQLRSDEIIPLRFKRTLKNGEIIKSDFLDFGIIHHGEEQITLKNDKQNTPLQITIKINIKQNSIQFLFNYRFYGLNVYQHLQSLAFFKAMSEDGITEIYRADSGTKVGKPQQEKLENTVNTNLLNFHLRVLDALVLIQEKFELFLKYTEDDLKDENLFNISQVIRVIKEGKLEMEADELKVDVKLKTAKEIIETYKNEQVSRIFATYPSVTSFAISGNEINLGNAVFSSNAYITKDHFEHIQKSIGGNQDVVEFCFTPVNEPIVVDFLKWDCADRHERIEFT